MTVKQLMKKLAKLPQDAIVIIPNTNHYVNGYYKATDVELWDFEDRTTEVHIDTDYKKRMVYDE